MKILAFSFVLSALSAPAYAQQTFVAAAIDVPAANAPLEYSVRNNQIVTGSAVSFEAGTATIDAKSDRALRTIKKYLDDKTYVSQLRIEGHTVCGKGDQALSEARAKAVAEWLIAQGTDCKRLVVTGFGCNKPIVADHGEMNARIEFVNVALRGKLIGGLPADGGGKGVAVNCP